MPHAVIYTRISNDPSLEAVGVANQAEACQKLADHLGVTVAQAYSDNDIGASDRTAKSKVRHEFNRMVEEVRLGTVTHILAYSNSRLTRRMLELETLIQLHEQTGVLIYTVVSGNDDLSTADGRMVARIKASVDAAESDRISERVKAALRAKAQLGEARVSAHRPFGYERDGVTLHPTESALVREAIQDIIDGVSVGVIRSRWNEAGVKTTTGKEWSWTGLQVCITSWRNAGIRTYRKEVVLDVKGQPVRGNWEPIFSVEQRERLLGALAARSKKKRRTSKHLLSRVLRCGVCGALMWGSVVFRRGEETKRYECSSGRGHNSINGKKLEYWIVREVGKELSQAKEEHEAKNVAREFPKQERYEEIPKIQAELMSTLVSGQLPSSLVIPQIEVLETELKGLVAERRDFYVEESETDTTSRYELMKRWVKEDFNSQKWTVERMVDSIVIKRGEMGAPSRTNAVFKERYEINWKI
jgi:site-specific DNA recombinase